MPRFIVIRAHPDLPKGFLPEELEGRWLDLDELPACKGAWPDEVPVTHEAVAVFTGRMERRSSDGWTARVFEVRP